MSRKKRGAPFSLFAFQDAITSVCGLVVLITLMLALNLTTSALLDDNERQNAEAAQEIRTRLEETKKKLDEYAKESEAARIDSDMASLTRNEIDELLSQSRQELEEERETEKALEKELDAAADSIAEKETLEKENEALKEQIAKARERASAAPVSDRGVIYGFPNDGLQKPIFVDFSNARIVATCYDEEATFKELADFVAWAKSRSKYREYFVFVVRPSGLAYYREIVDEELLDGYSYGVDLVGEKRTLEFLGREEEEAEVNDDAT